MTNTNEIKPATKAQIDALIELCKEHELFNAAGFLQLASDELDEAANGKKDCSCFLYMGDNSECPVHGGMHKNRGEVSSTEAKSNYFSDYGFSYQEKNDLYAMGMGY
jgi:hypothetical protein